MGDRLRQVGLAALAAWVVLLATSLDWTPRCAEADPAEPDASSDDDQFERMWANAACCVCHITFVTEELAKTHLEAKIPCIECHGLSAGHANDEDIGATPPDVTYTRDQVDASCEKCHKHHDVPARDVVARWLERPGPKLPPICTDCHGSHRIAEAAEEAKKPATDGS